MGPFEMVVYIVLISTGGAIIGKMIHARHGGGSSKDEEGDSSSWDWNMGMGGDSDKLSKKELKPYLEKIDALEERIRVLERIVTSKSDRISREIDEL